MSVTDQISVAVLREHHKNALNDLDTYVPVKPDELIALVEVVEAAEAVEREVAERVIGTSFVRSSAEWRLSAALARFDFGGER